MEIKASGDKSVKVKIGARGNPLNMNTRCSRRSVGELLEVDKYQIGGGEGGGGGGGGGGGLAILAQAWGGGGGISKESSLSPLSSLLFALSPFSSLLSPLPSL